jgi:HSP90 family molecular chaperone
MKQNVTLSIEKEILKKGKVVAARRDTSISKMLADLLKSIVENDERYEAAKRSALQQLKKGVRLGGKITWKREDLYER